MNRFPGRDDSGPRTLTGLLNAMRFFCIVEPEMEENEQWCVLQVIANQYLGGNLSLLRDIWEDWAAGRIEWKEL